MRKLASCSVLLVGVGGVGVEIAKNLVLAGVKSLYLLDKRPCSLHDLSSHFFISQQNIQEGISRAEASLKALCELNPYVEVNVCHHGGFDGDHDYSSLSFLQSYQCVIMTETSLHTQKKVNEFCRSQHPSIPFISADVQGLVSVSFVDVGSSFEVVDEDGEEGKEVFISDVTKSNPGVVTTLDHRLHGLVDGDHVSFKEITCMKALNHVVCPVKVLSPTQFSIIDTTPTSFHPFQHNGIAVKVKVNKTFNFESLKQQLSKPELVSADWCKSSMTSHLCMLALDDFKKTRDGEEPKAWDKGDCEEFVREAEKLNSQMHLMDWSDVDQSYLEKFSFTCSGQLACLCAFVGGVIAQECLKSLSNKFTPLKQWLFLDAMELCPDISNHQSSKITLQSFRNTRYFREIVCIGEHLFTKLINQKVFMVGCGAIGCELLKNFALLGLSTNQGKLTITDYDLIEKSNLNRQFLFRPRHIRQPKSTVAANSVALINPDIKIEAHQNKVCWETEATTYTDSFIRHNDIIVNALDNVEARKYMDGRCVTNQKPLMESGTMATKGHVQVIVPSLTESYASQSDPEEGGDIPYCTLKSFPSNIEHCIEWAREKFESVFVQRVQTYTQFWDRHHLLQLVEKLQSGETAPPKCKTALKLALELSSLPPPSSSPPSSSPPLWNGFITLARHKFEKYYNHKAKDLLNAFPMQTRNKDGSSFWQLPKRPPTPLQFDPNNPLHLLFIKSFSMLKASVAGCKPSQQEMQESYIKEVLKNVTVPEYVFKNKHIETDESVKKPKKDDTGDNEGGDDNDGEGEEVEGMLEMSIKLKDILNGKNLPSLTPEIFEKDDDSNGHIDIISALANLRACTYQIERKDRLEVKRVAGKIVPAIATTTAAVAALVTIELLKVTKGCPLSDLRNCFLNLAISLFVLSQPAAPTTTAMSNGITYNQWDQWVVRGDENTTLETFLKTLKKTYKLEPVLVVHGVKLVFSVDMAVLHRKRLKKALLSFIKVTEASKGYVDLVVSFKKGVDEEGKRIDENGPTIRFQFN